MNGILLIDKPSGMTSHGVVARARRILGERKIGHAGTLDPLATGVLVLLVGRATKLSDFLLNKEKCYRAGILLGCETDTYDTEGTVLHRCEPQVSREQLCAVLEQFTGVQQQLPPMYSAVKQNGKKLYELARAGQEVVRQPREITVHRLSLLSYDGVRAEAEISCSKGTYIRTLAHDMGQALGCGACLDSLRRTASGAFTAEQAVDLEALEAGAYSLLPTHSVFPYPSVTVTGREAERIRNGTGFVSSLAPGDYKLFSEEGAFLCTARAEVRARGCYLQPVTMFLEER